MLLCICSVKLSNCIKNKRVACEAQLSVSLVLLQHFHIFCDLLWYRPMTKWNLLVFHDKKARCCGPFLTPKISLVILLIVSHIVLVMFLWRIIGSTKNPLFVINIFLYSRYLSAWYCFDLVRRNSVLVTHRS